MATLPRSNSRAHAVRWSLLSGTSLTLREPISDINARRFSYIGFAEQRQPSFRQKLLPRRFSSAGSVDTLDEDDEWEFSCASAREFDRLRNNLGIQDDVSLDTLFLRMCLRRQPSVPDIPDLADSDSSHSTDASEENELVSISSSFTEDLDYRPIVSSLSHTPPPPPKRSTKRPMYIMSQQSLPCTAPPIQVKDLISHVAPSSPSIHGLSGIVCQLTPVLEDPSPKHTVTENLGTSLS
ncbi:hypothetical protein ACI68E_000921 [Malassezia pachydermatis]